MPRRPRGPTRLLRGPFTVAEARQAGLERWHLAGQSWKRLTRGSYVSAAVGDDPMIKLADASRRLPPGAVFSGLTAAWLHGLDVGFRTPIEATVPPRSVSARAGIVLRRAVLDDNDVVMAQGMRTTCVERTLAELSVRLPVDEAVAIADAALHGRRTSLARLSSWIEANAGRHGARALRRVTTFAEPRAESPMESRLRMVLVQGGLPRPKAQASIYDRSGRFVGRPDLYYEEQRLGIEYDGGTHRNSLVDDNRRQNRLLSVGVRLLRFTAPDVLGNPGGVVGLVATALNEAPLS